MERPFRITLSQYESEGYVPLHLVLFQPGKHSPGKYHDHDFSEIAIVMGGTATHDAFLTNTSEMRRTKLSRGDVLVLHPGVTHSYNDTEDLELYNIVFDTKRLLMPLYDAEVLPFFQKLFPRKLPTLEQFLNPVLRLSPEEVETCREKVLGIQQEMASPLPGSYFSTMSRFMEMLVWLARLDNELPEDEEVTPERRIAVSLNYMNRHYADGKITLDSLGEVANMSKRNFTRYFRKVTGTSPTEYMQRIRMSKALYYLSNSNYKIEDLALRCGFCNGAYFCRCFMKVYGSSPSEYRDRLTKAH